MSNIRKNRAGEEDLFFDTDRNNGTYSITNSKGQLELRHKINDSSIPVTIDAAWKNNTDVHDYILSLVDLLTKFERLEETGSVHQSYGQTKVDYTTVNSDLAVLSEQPSGDVAIFAGGGSVQINPDDFTVSGQNIVFVDGVFDDGDEIVATYSWNAFSTLPNAVLGEANEGVNTGSFVGVFRQKNGVDLQFKSIQSSNASLVITDNGTNIDITTPAGTGEANTASNVGGFIGLFDQKVGPDLQFKTIQSSDASITILDNAGDIDVKAVDQGGEANTITNFGGFAELFIQKTGVDLELRTMQSSDSSITVTQNGSDIDLAVVPETRTNLIQSIDLTNGGANDLALLDIPHDISWDKYDYLDFNIIDLETSDTTVMAWALAENSAPTVFLTMPNTTAEAWGVTTSSIVNGDITQLYQRFSNFSRQKQPFAIHAENSGRILAFQHGVQGGVVWNYAGTTVSGGGSKTSWYGWDTGSNKFTDHTLRLICNTGTMTGGTLEIRGRYL